MNRGRRVPCSSSTFCHSLGTGGQLEVATLLPSVLRNYSVLILVAMEQEGKTVKIPSELNFSKCPERFGFCEGSSLMYWLFSCLSSSGISLCLNSKGSVLLHMPWLAVQRFPAAVPLVLVTHRGVLHSQGLTPLMSRHFGPLEPNLSPIHLRHPHQLL